MIEVRAKHGIKYGNVQYDGGQVFKVTEAEYDELKEFVEKVGYVSNVFPPIQQEEKPKVRRKKKE